MDDIEIDLTTPQKAAVTPESFAEWKSDRDLGAAMLEGYRPQLAADLERFEVIGSEIAFTVSILGVDPVDTLRGGVIDLPLREKSSGNIWIMDHKSFSPESWAQYQNVATLDEQATGYLSAYETVAHVRPVGFIGNALIKRVAHPPAKLKNGSLSKAKDQNTTPELYRAAIAENKLNAADYAEFVAHLEANRKTYYARSVVTRTDFHIQRFEKTFAADVQEKAKGFVNRNISPRTCGSCAFKFLCEAWMRGIELSDEEICMMFDRRNGDVPAELFGKIQAGVRVESFSSIGAWKNCRQASKYSETLAPKTTAKYFRFGTGIHLALADGYHGGDMIRVWTEFCDAEFFATFGVTSVEAGKRVGVTE